MFELYLIRHGLAGKRLDDEAKDQLRPLTKKGKEKMKNIAKGLNKLNITFDVILTSPLVRAEETAEIISAHCGMSKAPKVTELLMPNASYQSLTKSLNQLKEPGRIAIVGHEPFLSGFVSFCLSKSNHSFIKIKKGGVLMLEIDKVLKPERCKLCWLMEPRHIIN